MEKHWRPMSVETSLTTGTDSKFRSVLISAMVIPLVSGLTVKTASSMTCQTVRVLGSRAFTKYSAALLKSPFGGLYRSSLFLLVT